MDGDAARRAVAALDEGERGGVVPPPFGTKTIYVAGPAAPPAGERPLHVSMLARHGTRNPTKSSVARMRAVAARLRGAGADEGVLRRWEGVLDVFEEDAGGLTWHGKDEMFGLGVRFRRRYAFGRRDAVRVRSSFKPRATASAEAFVQGFVAVDVEEIARVEVEAVEDEAADAVEGAGEERGDTPPAGDAEAHTAMSGPGRTEQQQQQQQQQQHADLFSTSSVSSESCDEDEGDGERVVDLLAAALAQPPRELRVDVLPEGDDAPLRFFEHHPEYAAFVRAHKIEQRTRLSRSPSVAAFMNGAGDGRGGKMPLGARLAAAFGVDVSVQERAGCLDSEHIRVLAEAAAFDCAHGRADSLFASVLTDADIFCLEDFERRYRPFFAGHERFGSVTAPLVQDLMDSLTAVVDNVRAGTPYVAADLRFAHAETLVPLLLLLGINSNALPPGDPGARTGLSAISPFAANIAIELFAPAAPGAAFRVRFRLHEHYVDAIPALGADGVGFIELDKLLAFCQTVLDENHRDKLARTAGA